MKNVACFSLIMFLATALLPVPTLVTGPGPGPANPPEVRTWDPDDTGAPLAQWPAYGVDQFGVNVAAGDLDGDGFDEILTVPGPDLAAAARILAWNADNGSVSPVPGLDFVAHDQALTHGGSIAAGLVE